jgi:hypothetical protein
VGLGKPETFDFVGFTFISGKSREGRFLVRRKSRRDRVKAKLKEIKVALRANMHKPIPEQGSWLGRLSEATSPTTPCRLISVRSWRSATMSPISGCARFGVAARKIARRGLT